MTIEAPTRSVELAHYFKLMGMMCEAKAADDVDAIAGLIGDLEMMARFARMQRVRAHASAEAEHATSLLADLQAKRIGYIGPQVTLTSAAAPANLN